MPSGGRRPGSGRKPTPIEQRRAMGNPQRRPLPDIVTIGGRPDEDEFAIPPEHLPEMAQQLWRRDVQKLVALGTVDRVDYAALEAMCIFYARAMGARRIIESEGYIAVAKNGTMREHPAMKIERESWSKYLGIAEQFGLTPVSRARLGLATVTTRTLAHDLAEKERKPLRVVGEVIDAEVIEETTFHAAPEDE